MLTTILASFLLFLITCLIFANSRRILTVGYRTLTFICILTILRLFLPIEFLFATNLIVNDIVANVIFFVVKGYKISPHITISIWALMLVIWGIGIVIQLLKYIQNYRKTKATIQTFGILVSNKEKYVRPLISTCTHCHVPQKFQIYEIPLLSTPMIFSMRTPYILFPAENHYTEEELSFIFRHEIMHFIHHHLFYQFLVQLFSIIYWWNPLNAYIKKQIDALLEMNVDGSFSETKEETTRYLECLLKVRKGEIQPQTIPNTCALSLNSLDETALEKRFQLLTNKSSKRSFSSILLIVGSLTIFILSYAFTLKAHAVPANTDTCKYFTLTSENAYAISRDDGTFDLYLYGEFLENVDSLTYYDSSLPIYSEAEVLP